MGPENTALGTPYLYAELAHARSDPVAAPHVALAACGHLVDRMSSPQVYMQPSRLLKFATRLCNITEGMIQGSCPQSPVVQHQVHQELAAAHCHTPLDWRAGLVAAVTGNSSRNFLSDVDVGRRVCAPRRYGHTDTTTSRRDRVQHKGLHPPVPCVHDAAANLTMLRGCSDAEVGAIAPTPTPAAAAHPAAAASALPFTAIVAAGRGGRSDDSVDDELSGAGADDEHDSAEGRSVAGGSWQRDSSPSCAERTAAPRRHTAGAVAAAQDSPAAPTICMGDTPPPAAPPRSVVYATCSSVWT